MDSQQERIFRYRLNKLKFSFLLLLGLLCFLQEDRSLAESSFSFAICGDSHIDSRKPPNHPWILSWIVEDLNQIKPDFVIHNGDGPNVDTLKNYQRFIALLKPLAIPLKTVVGNHDIAVPGTGKVSRAHYRYFFGECYYAFAHKNSYFIVLDTGGSRPGVWGIRESTPDGRQWQWLVNELKESRNRYRHRFVILHVPPSNPWGKATGFSQNHWFANEKEAQDFQKLMSEYKIDLVLCAHDHSFFHYQSEGVNYLESGGAGGKLFLPAYLGGFYHFVLIKVNEDKVSWNLIPVLNSLSIQLPQEDLIVGGKTKLVAVGTDPVGNMFPLIFPIALGWGSSNRKVATIEPFNGKLIALAQGQTTITVRCGVKQASMLLTVKAKKAN